MIFLIAANVMAFITYYQYFRQVKHGLSTPNPATWLIWLSTGFLNVITYGSITDNIYNTFFMWVIVFWVLLILIYSIIEGKLQKISGLETTALAIVIALYLLYFFTRNDVYTHVLLQTIYAISYVPTVVALINGKAKEKVTAWILAFITYFLSLLTLFYNREQNWLEYLHILVNGILGNGLIIYLIYRSSQKAHFSKL